MNRDLLSYEDILNYSTHNCSIKDDHCFLNSRIEESSRVELLVDKFIFQLRVTSNEHLFAAIIDTFLGSFQYSNVLNELSKLFIH
jgi:hypothetical protein